MKAFTLCELKHYTLNEFIMYVKDVSDIDFLRHANAIVTPEIVVGEVMHQFAIKHIVELKKGDQPLHLTEATHQVSAYRISKAETNTEVTIAAGKEFFLTSCAVGEYNTELSVPPIKSEAISRFILDMINQGFVLYDTFGFIAGKDFPYNVGKTKTLTKFWYKVENPITHEIETMTPWLGSYLVSPTKLVIDIIK